MQVNLMVNMSDANEVNKTLVTYKMGINVTLKDTTELLTPTLRLSKDLGIELDAFNYVYIPDFSRYYYVTNSAKDLGGVIVIDCKVDVLMSHKTAIGNLTAIVERQENYFNLFLQDLNIPNLAYKRVQTLAFPNNVFNGGQTAVLVVNGG